MSSIVIAGDTSGSVTLQAPPVAGGTVLTLPTVSGTLLTNNEMVPKTSGGTGTTQVRSVAQIVSVTSGTVAVGTTTGLWTNAVPLTTNTNQFMSLGITPISATSLLEIEISLFLAPNAISWCNLSLFRDTTTTALTSSAWYESIATAGRNQILKFYVTAGSTNTTTFYARAGSSGGAITFNGQASTTQYMGGAMNSYIVIKEYLA